MSDVKSTYIETASHFSVFTIGTGSATTLNPDDDANCAAAASIAMIRPLSGVTPPPSYSVALDQLASAQRD